MSKKPYIKPHYRPTIRPEGLTSTEANVLSLVTLDRWLIQPENHPRLIEQMQLLDGSDRGTTLRALNHLRHLRVLRLPRATFPNASLAERAEILGDLLSEAWRRQSRAEPPRAVLAALLRASGVSTEDADLAAYATVLPNLPEAGPPAVPVHPWPKMARHDLGLSTYTQISKSAHTRLLALLELDPRLSLPDRFDHLVKLIQLFDPSMTRKEISRRMSSWWRHRDDDPLLRRIYQARDEHVPTREAADARIQRLGELSGWAALPAEMAKRRFDQASALLAPLA